MNKKLLIIAMILSIFSITSANDYTCTADWNNSSTKYNLYSNWTFEMTDSSDTYKCANYWMQWNTLDAKWWNDKIYISKNTWTKQLTINMWDWDDTFYHTFHNVQLNWTTINGWNWNDTVNIAWANREDFTIVWDCKNSCIITNKKSPYLFKNVKLTSIENLIFNNKQVSTTTTTNTANTSTTNNYPEIDLSSYKTIIPAYWWSHTLNNKLTELNSHSAIVIVNPNNGDFSKTEDIFKEEIKDTKEKNNLPIWYIHTWYGKRDISAVENVIDNWLKYYPNIDGFFLDEASNNKDELDYYTKLYNYIKTKNPNLVVVINPGTTPDEWYFNIADNIVSYESSCSNYSKHEIPSWLETYGNKVILLWYSCTQEQHDNLKKEYWNKYIIYFTDDWADWNPWDSLSEYAIQPDWDTTTTTNTTNTTKTTNTTNTTTPYSFTKFHNILDVSKLTYPDGHTLIRKQGDYEWYKSDFFYATKEWQMVFAIKKHEWKYKERVELRQRINGEDGWWNLSKNTIHILKEKVKLQKLSDTNGLEYTFSQIHSEGHPLLRMAVDKEKNWITDHIWAIVRITTKNSWKETQRYDLWEVNPDNFYSFTIKVGNNKLEISRNWKEYVNKNISYWTETKNYFKAWIYLSHANYNSLAYNVKVLFDELIASEDTNSSNTNSSNTNSSNTKEIKENNKKIERDNKEIVKYQKKIKEYGSKINNYKEKIQWYQNKIEEYKQENQK